MQLYVKDGAIVAVHEDNQSVRPSVYGEGVTLVPYYGLLDPAERVGSPPAKGQPDTRPMALPKLSREDLIAVAAARRWLAETAGIDVAGVRVPTDDRAKMLVSGAASSMADADEVLFKAASGFVSLTGVQIRAIRDAITAHVAACFAKEAAVVAAIQARTIKTIAAIEAAGWPA